VIDEEVARILEESYNETIAILEKNRLLLDKLTEALLAKEKVNAEEFEEIYRTYAVDFKPAPGDGEIEKEHSFSPEEMQVPPAQAEGSVEEGSQSGEATISFSGWFFSS
jgi:hypothetical protein